MNSNKIIQDQIRIYNQQIKKFGDSPKATLNQKTDIQDLRFERLLTHLEINLEHASIHDVGCGICDLYKYIKSTNRDYKYSGSDIVPAMKTLSKKKYPEIKYYLRDIIKDEINERYDYVVLSGVFNLPGSTNKKEWKEFTRKMILKMYEISNKAISFNFLSKNADFFNPEMYYESIDEIISFSVKNLSRHFIIDHAYPLHEFTFTVLKPEFIKDKFNSSTFKKYLKQ